MRFGVLGVIASDWTDVTHESIAFVRELGFSGIGAHLTVPASTITDARAEHVRSCIDGNDLELIQLWGRYPTIISEDEDIRRAGVEAARDIVRLQPAWAFPSPASDRPATTHAVTGGPTLRTTAGPARTGSCAASGGPRSRRAGRGEMS